MTTRTFSLTFVACILFSASASWAGSIGINFVGNGAGPGNGHTTTLTSGMAAGVVPVTNYNNVTGSGSTVALVDNSNNAAGSITFSGGGTYTTSPTAPVGGDEILNNGDVYGTTTGTVTVPAAFAQGKGYDVYLYTENDANGRDTTTSLTPLAGSTTTYYYAQISGASAGQVDGSGNYTYLKATNSTNSSDFSQVANYALFSGLHAASFSFSTSATNNGALSGIEIVQATPEPSTFILGGIAAAGLLIAVRRRRKA
jgi:hypothetical protein